MMMGKITGTCLSRHWHQTAVAIIFFTVLHTQKQTKNPALFKIVLDKVVKIYS
jgi:hypothetical protein